MMPDPGGRHEGLTVEVGIGPGTVGTTTYRVSCSCGWVAPWSRSMTEAYLEHAAHERRMAAPAPTPVAHVPPREQLR